MYARPRLHLGFGLISKNTVNNPLLIIKESEKAILTKHVGDSKMYSISQVLKKTIKRAGVSRMMGNW